MTTIKTQNFGVEIELTGITREKGAKVISEYFGGTTIVNHVNDGYDTCIAYDSKNRKWKCSRDISIRPEVKTHGNRHYVNENRSYDDHRCEVVTPILQYEDIEDLQNIVRKLVEAGALANQSCGIHVHVDGANHTPDSLIRLLGFAVGRQDLFYEALEIGAREHQWCRKTNPNLLTAMKGCAKTKDAIEHVWYGAANDHYCGGIDHSHYNSTRYHGINLHAFFTKGTVEFRLFNGTTHAGKIKAYVQFCLAMSAWAINANDNYHFSNSNRIADKEKRGILMEHVLTNRLGLKGREFATCRQHLTAAFKPATAQATAA